MKSEKFGMMQESHQINMTVHSDDDFLSPYSPTETPVISSDVADFLENSAKAFMPNGNLQLCISGDCIDENEKRQYPKAIKNYFDLQLKSLLQELKRNAVVSLIFAVIGILGLAAMLVFSHFFENAIWVECLDIFAWVFLWEAVDQFFIERHALHIKKKRLQALASMQVKFL